MVVSDIGWGTFLQRTTTWKCQLAAILGFIMVSKVPYMHFGKWLGSKKNNKLKMFIVIIFFMAFAKKSVLMSALVINVYVIWGLIKYFLLKIKSKI